MRLLRLFLLCKSIKKSFYYSYSTIKKQTLNALNFNSKVKLSYSYSLNIRYSSKYNFLSYEEGIRHWVCFLRNFLNQANMLVTFSIQYVKMKTNMKNYLPFTMFQMHFFFLCNRIDSKASWDTVSGIFTLLVLLNRFCLRKIHEMFCRVQVSTVLHYVSVWRWCKRRQKSHLTNQLGMQSEKSWDTYNTCGSLCSL